MGFHIAPPERQPSMQLTDGRILAWSEWGPINGMPVLFCTGAAMSGSLGFGSGDLARLGQRLVAVDRPGLGRSDSHPEKDLFSWANDMRQLIESHNLRNPTAVGFSQGTPFALVLAAENIVSAVAIVSGQDDLNDPRITPQLQAEVAEFLGNIQRDPDGFEQGFAQIATLNALWQLIIGMSSERDRSVYLRPDFSEAYRRSLEEGFIRGARPYVRDLVNAFSPWPFKLEAIGVPVDLWYGSMDASTVHSPDFGVTMAARLPNASRFLEPEEGGSILWTRSGEILGRLKSRVTGN